MKRTAKIIIFPFLETETYADRERVGAGGVITRKIGDRAGELAFGNACRRQFFVHDARTELV